MYLYLWMYTTYGVLGMPTPLTPRRGFIYLSRIVLRLVKINHSSSAGRFLFNIYLTSIASLPLLISV